MWDGGKINFENPSAQNVQWKTLSYGPANNGGETMYQDLSPVDIIYLMEDMDLAI